MRNIFILMFMVAIFASCGSTAEVQKPVVGEGLPEREASNRPQRKPALDAEQLAAQLGLSDEKTDEFVTMWNTTGDKMRQVRRDYREADANTRIAKMQEVKAERDAGLESILTDAQLDMFYEIMAKNRPKMPRGMRKSMGN